MEVVGYDEVTGEAIMGDDVEGDVMGAPRHRRARMMRIPQRPAWRAQLAPGVIQPDEGMLPLPLTPLVGGGTFAAALPTITFQGQLQKPFRAERLLVSSVRTGATANGRLLGQFFVGTDMQQAEIQAWDIELVGQATSFGTRLTAKAAEPGVLIRFLVTATPAPTGTDTIFATLLILGRLIH